MVVNMFHYDSLALLKEKLFSKVIDVHHVIGKKKAINIDGNKHYGYFLEKGQHVYFIDDLEDENKSVIDLFPIIVHDMYETDYNKQVFFYISTYDSVKIPTEKRMSWRKLIDTMNDFKHTNDIHWLLCKLILGTSWVNRINYRIIATRGFGKDSVIEAFSELVGNTANIYGATFAKLEYCVKNKLLIFNEMGNLKAEDKKNMQEFLLNIGGFRNKYIKRSRATDGALEEYNISKQSLGIVYNPPSYYVEKGQEFFDTMFTKAVLDRFMPFYLEGKLDESFDSQFDVNGIVNDNLQTYKDIISTLMWFQKHPVKNRYLVPDDLGFDENTRRYERSFLTICNYISEYAEDDEELYYKLIYELYNTHTKYNKVVKDSLMMIG
jgi:hypothetical protein